MAGISVTGLDQIKANFREISKAVSTEGMEAAHQAAAKIFSQAAKNAAPQYKAGTKLSFKKVKVGQLKSSVGIVKGKDDSLTVGGTATKVKTTYVGPTKKTGYYGYWLSEGWEMPLRKTTHWERPGRWSAQGRWIVSKRRRRIEQRVSAFGGRTHSQGGTLYTKKIPAPYPNWFKQSVEGVMGTASRAAMTAFDYYMQKFR